MKILVKDVNKILKNSSRLYITSKYISDGNIAFNRNLINNIDDLINKSNTNNRISIIESDAGFNSVIDIFSITRDDVDYLSEVEVKIDDFIYTDSKALYRRGYTYYTQDKESKTEVCTGINPYYLEMIKKLNKDLKGELKILEIVYSTRSKYNPIFGFYRLLDKADNFLGVVCGIIHSKDYFNKIEKI